MLDGLRTFRGVGLVVSHSRTLLDTLTTSTLRLANQHLVLWPLPFSQAKEQWEADRARRHEERAHTQKTLQREERALSDQRRTLQSSSRSRSTAVRMRNLGDSEARTLGADFRAEQAEMAHAATLRRIATKAERVRGQLDALEFEEEAGHDFHFADDACPRPTVLQFRGPEAPGGSFQLQRGEHVWLRGPNGAGKTTLVRALLASCELPKERVLVLPQELSLEEGVADLEAVRALPKDERGRVLQLVHALGVEPDQLLRSQSPSPGEARKLRLGLGLGREAWLAVLDEPTNHLDLPSVERLEAALKAFPSALLLVTHDARLGEAVCTRAVDVKR